MRQWIKHLLGTMFCAVALLGLTGCDEDRPTEPPKGDGGIDMVVDSDAQELGRSSLGPCDSLKTPEGTRLIATLFARGDQVYRWDGAGWVFVEPVAKLYVDRHSRWVVGTHYAGPTWESRRGSKVVGAVLKRCPADPASIPWLLLQGTPSGGRGIFHNASFIQRIHTAGGIAPAQPGTTVGELRRVPYTADYRFYRGK